MLALGGAPTGKNHPSSRAPFSRSRQHSEATIAAAAHRLHASTTSPSSLCLPRHVIARSSRILTDKLPIPLLLPAPVRSITMGDAHPVLPARDLPPEHAADGAVAAPRDVRGARVAEATRVLRTRDAQRRLPDVQRGARPARARGAVQPPRQLHDRLPAHGQDHGRGQHADGVRQRPGVLEGGASRVPSVFYSVLVAGWRVTAALTGANFLFFRFFLRFYRRWKRWRRGMTGTSQTHGTPTSECSSASYARCSSLDGYDCVGPDCVPTDRCTCICMMAFLFTSTEDGKSPRHVFVYCVHEALESSASATRRRRMAQGM